MFGACFIAAYLPLSFYKAHVTLIMPNSEKSKRSDVSLFTFLLQQFKYVIDFQEAQLYFLNHSKDKQPAFSLSLCAVRGFLKMHVLLIWSSLYRRVNLVGDE